MPAGTRSAIAMLTDFFVADDLEATARRTGFVQRTSKITGKLFLALVTFGTWSEGKTTLAQLAAKGTQLPQPVEVSPEALHQRMNKQAIAFLQDMLRQVLAKLQSLTPVLTITNNFRELRERPKGEVVDNKKGAVDNKP